MRPFRLNAAGFSSVMPKFHHFYHCLSDVSVLAAFAAENDISLTIIGPEAPLVGGICDFFAERGPRTCRRR